MQRPRRLGHCAAQTPYRRRRAQRRSAKGHRRAPRHPDPDRRRLDASSRERDRPTPRTGHRLTHPRLRHRGGPHTPGLDRIFSMVRSPYRLRHAPGSATLPAPRSAAGPRYASRSLRLPLAPASGAPDQQKCGRAPGGPPPSTRQTS